MVTVSFQLSQMDLKLLLFLPPPGIWMLPVNLANKKIPNGLDRGSEVGSLRQASLIHIQGCQSGSSCGSSHSYSPKWMEVVTFKVSQSYNFKTSFLLWSKLIFLLLEYDDYLKRIWKQCSTFFCFETGLLDVVWWTLQNELKLTSLIRTVVVTERHHINSGKNVGWHCFVYIQESVPELLLKTWRPKYTLMVHCYYRP